MKKLFAAVLALLLVTGCGAKEEEDHTAQIAPDPQPVAEDTENNAQNQENSTPVEIPVEITSVPEDAPYEVELLEGLAGDAVGYSLEIPTFSKYNGNEVIHKFYVDMVDNLETYTQGTVHDTCLERHCMANVFGRVDGAWEEDGLLTVEYSYEVQFTDQEEPDVNTRTDVFDVETGEKQ